MYWVPEKKIFNECVSQNCESQPIKQLFFKILYDPTQFLSSHFYPLLEIVEFLVFFYDLECCMLKFQASVSC